MESNDDELVLLPGLRGLSVEQLLRYTRPVSPPPGAPPIPYSPPYPLHTTEVYLSEYEDETADSGNPSAEHSLLLLSGLQAFSLEQLQRYSTTVPAPPRTIPIPIGAPIPQGVYTIDCMEVALVTEDQLSDAPAELLRLPPELIIEILTFLPWKDAVRSRHLCKWIRKAIDRSIEFQYLIALAKGSMSIPDMASAQNIRWVLELVKRLYEAARSKVTVGMMEEDIAEATATVAKTQESFRFVFAKLEIIDEDHDRKFAPKWDELRKGYDNTLAVSRDLASDFTDWCDRSYGPLMVDIKNKPTNLEAKKKTVERAMKATKKFEECSAEIADRFNQLALDLISFSEIMRGLDLLPKDKVQLQEDLKRLLAEIKEIKKSIDKINKNVDKPSSSKTSELDATVESGLLPSVGSYLKGVFSSKFNADDLDREYKKLDELEKEKQAVLLKLNLSENLQELTTRIDACKPSCLLFEAIWIGTKYYCHGIMSDLEACQEEEDEEYFKAMIPASHYLILACGLRKYTQGVVV